MEERITEAFPFSLHVYRGLGMLLEKQQKIKNIK